MSFNNVNKIVKVIQAKTGFFLWSIYRKYDCKLDFDIFHTKYIILEAQSLDILIFLAFSLYFTHKMSLIQIWTISVL